MSSRSLDLYKRAKKRIPGGVCSPVRSFDPYPFYTKSASGSRITSVDGIEYIDYCMAYGPLIFGHAYHPLVNGVKDAITSGVIYGTPTENEVDLSEMINDIIPSLEMMRFVSTGAEATMHAIRLARGFTGRSKIVKFDGGYHGTHDSMLVESDSTPSSLGVPGDVSRNTTSIPYNNFQAMEDLFSREGSRIAAVIVEPVMGNAGVITPMPSFLQELRRITKENDSLLIFDEVITGFRLALGGAQEYFEIEADLVTYGKILGGGFPLALFGGRSEIMSILSPLGEVRQAGTYNGNPISVVASLIVLEELKGKGIGLFRELEQKQRVITDYVNDMIIDKELNLTVNRIASMFQIFFTKNDVRDYAGAMSSDSSRFTTYFQELLQHEVFIPPSQFETCFLSTSHVDSDLRRTSELIGDSLLKIL